MEEEISRHVLKQLRGEPTSKESVITYGRAREEW